MSDGYDKPDKADECDPRYVEGWILAHKRREMGETLEVLRDRPSADGWSEEKRNGFNDRVVEEYRDLHPAPASR